LNWVDILLIAIFIIAAFNGYREGFLMELFSLLALLLGVLGSFKLLGWAIVFLDGRFGIDDKYLPYISFAVVFIIIVIAVRLLGNLIKFSIDRTFLGSVDQIAGCLLGVIRSAFILSVLLWLADSFKVTIPDKWATDSWLLPKVAAFAPQLTDWLGEFFPFFHDVF
jgi:membrane protein required for colicin V production